MATTLNLQALTNAQASLKEALDNIEIVPEQLYRTYRAGCIQNFEFCWDLSTNYMKKWLKQNDKPAMEARI